MGRSTSQYYYYAGGRRVPLELDADHVAVEAAELEAKKGLAGVAGEIRRLPGGLAVVPTASLPDGLRKSLEAAGRVQPVFRAKDTKLVVLPEVRVEIDEAKKRTLMRLIESGDLPAVVERDEGTTLVLRPVSGAGADALTLANLVQERVAPAMSQAHFVRLLRKPVPQSRGRSGRSRG